MSGRRYFTTRDFPVGRDEQGRPLCRWCKGVVEPPRRTLCSAPCVHEMSVRTNPGYCRSMVAHRDQGVCSSCGFNTKRAKAVLLSFRERAGSYHNDRGPSLHLLWRAWKAMEASAMAGGFVDRRGHWWEADHVVAVEDGGGDLGLDNLRTLCLRCHKARTREQAGARAARKAAAKPAPQMALAMSLLLLAALTACSRGTLTEPTPGASGWVLTDNSTQAAYNPIGDPGGGWHVELPGLPRSINYAWRRAGTDGTGKTLTLTYALESVGDEPLELDAALPSPGYPGADSNPATLRLYLTGGFPPERWWCNESRRVLAPGVVTISCPLEWTHWSGVYGEPNRAAFERDVVLLTDVGFTFGGASFAGHGVAASRGRGVFRMVGMEVQ